MPRTVGAALTLLAIGLAGCKHSRPAHNLDLDAIRISGDARMRTDTVGDGKFASTATFVLVDAENTAGDGAYVTLGGELLDGRGLPSAGSAAEGRRGSIDGRGLPSAGSAAEGRRGSIDAGGDKIGQLKPQSLWVPAHDVRTFALVDTERAARPTSTAARVTIQGAVIPDEPPRAHVEELHSFDDNGKVVVQAYVVNAADRIGQLMVVGSFHDAHDQPMTRPFQMIQLAAHDKQVVQFVGPTGAKRGTIFVGDVIY